MTTARLFSGSRQTFDGAITWLRCSGCMKTFPWPETIVTPARKEHPTVPTYCPCCGVQFDYTELTPEQTAALEADMRLKIRQSRQTTGSPPS